METKECPFCWKDIEKEASRCPYCDTTFYKKTEGRNPCHEGPSAGGDKARYSDSKYSGGYVE